MTELERLPLRLERRLSRALEVPGDLQLWPQGEGKLPMLRGELRRPAKMSVAFTVRVHSRAGIPLAHASIEVKAGDRSFETPVRLLGMEGYARLGNAERQRVERRMWLRRSYATGTPA